MHIGQLIKQKVKEQHRSTVWLSRQLSYSRTNVYKIYEKSSVDTEVLLRISAILGYDFFSVYSNELNYRKTVSNKSTC